MQTRVLFALMLAVLLSSHIFADANLAKSKKMSQVQYIGGGIASVFLPYGIGQSIQGRYREKAWIFTASELASSAVVSTGFIWSLVDIAYLLTPGKTLNDYQFNSANLPIGGVALMAVGGLAFLGIHLWEIIDAWGAPQWEGRVALRRHSEQKMAILPIINPNYWGVAIKF